METGVIIKGLQAENANLKGVFTKTYRGNSMYPKLSGGETLICRELGTTKDFLWGEIYLIASGFQAETFIGRPQPSDIPGNIRLHRDNPRFADLEIPTGEINGVAMVVGSVSLWGM